MASTPLPTTSWSSAPRRWHPPSADFPLIDWALGGESPRQAELLSYLLFDPVFVAAAVEQGASDARRAIDRR